MKLTRFARLILVMLVLMPSVMSAHMMDIDISVSNNNIVREDFLIHMEPEDSYDTISYLSVAKPLSVIYDGEFRLIETEQGFLIELKAPKEFDNQIRFSLLLDNLIDKGYEQRTFRTTFHPASIDELSVRLTLPTHFILSPREPSATPKPQDITTDGRAITLEWSFKDSEEIDIAVFYTNQSPASYIWIGILAAAFIVLISYYYFRKKTHASITGMLSIDEQKVVELLRIGVTKQNEIAETLDFSKSKMSKVLRKLEEKELIDKSVYFKTNIIKLKKIK